MEPSQKLEYKLAQLDNALKGFKASLNIQLSMDDDIIHDAIRNGQLHKFEFAIELFWKFLKSYLAQQHKVDSGTPATVLKSSFTAGILNEEQFNSLDNALLDRNIMSHVYSDKEFEKIVPRLPSYYSAMKQVYDYIVEEMKSNK